MSDDLDERLRRLKISTEALPAPPGLREKLERRLRAPTVEAIARFGGPGLVAAALAAACALALMWSGERALGRALSDVRDAGLLWMGGL